MTVIKSRGWSDVMGSRLLRFTVAPLILGVAVLVAASFSTGFYLVLPGQVFDARKLISLREQDHAAIHQSTQEGAGQILVTTVATGRLRAIDLAFAHLLRDPGVVREEDLLGPSLSLDLFLQSAHSALIESRSLAEHAVEGFLGLEGDRELILRFQSTGFFGSSGGLALALEITNSLTPGLDLTGGQPVAVTGSVSPQGIVGRVGGVPQKLDAARRAGAKVFILPLANLPDVGEYSEGPMRLIAVSSLAEAVRALAGEGWPIPALEGTR